MSHRVPALLLTFAVVAALLVAPGTVGAAAQNSPTHYLEMPDHTLIAINLQLPPGTPPSGGWPTIIQIDGYGGGSVPMPPAEMIFGDNNYATVHMSLRGTGCSGGNFDLFDQRSAEDGYNVIERLATDRATFPMLSDRVAIWGHSYSGLTGWLVAATQPPHLVAMSVSGLIDDLYRGIVYMGGVSNLGFPLLWTGAYRPRSDYADGVGGGLQAADKTCAANLAGRIPPAATDDAIANGIASLGEDNQWWRSHSLINYLDGINVPIHIVQTYQDEQTGPRGSNLLWQRLEERKPWLPKRLLLTNGVHSTNTRPPEIAADRTAWLDCYVRNVCTSDILSQASRVKVLWEMHNADGVPRSNAVTTDASWPLAQTRWTRYFFGADHSLSTDPGSSYGTDAYVSGSKRAGAWTYLAGAGGSNYGAEATTANLPDEVRYSTAAFTTNTAIAGPIDVTLRASSTAPDTEFYVELNDVDAAGNMTRLQRGMLKASHREIDPLRTDYNAAGEIIRPYNPHTNTLTNTVRPGLSYAYHVEVFPLGHVFRPGHRLVLRVTNPPQADSLAHYVQTTPAGVNAIAFGPGASSILLPIVDVSGLSLGPDLGCAGQIGLERCSRPVN